MGVMRPTVSLASMSRLPRRASFSALPVPVSVIVLIVCAISLLGRSLFPSLFLSLFSSLCLPLFLSLFLFLFLSFFPSFSLYLSFFLSMLPCRLWRGSARSRLSRATCSEKVPCNGFDMMLGALSRPIRSAAPPDKHHCVVFATSC